MCVKLQILQLNIHNKRSETHILVEEIIFIKVGNI